ncbi:hypothetical protein [Snuella lapsa]|uniref:Peptidase C39-like domain-containing protein n=1 Tax=Snuella lapsa TaxID=870481 RepID=A0ABP6XBN6_9FLAO
MKKSLFKVCGTVIVLLLLVYSCQKDQELFDDSTNASFGIEEARTWFEANNSPIILLSGLGNENAKSSEEKKTDKPIVFQNDWEHAFTSKKGHLEVVEVALKSMGRIGHASMNSYNKWRETNNRDYFLSLSRLVIIKNKNDNSIESYIMTMVGETSYIEKKKFQQWNNTYLKKDNDYSGMVLFYTVMGDFVNGWELTNGKVTGKVTKGESKSSTVSKTASTAKSSSDCQTYYGITTYEQCTDWYSIGETDDEYFQYYSGTTCETWDEITESFTICAPETEDPDPYAGGGGGTSGSYNPQSGDKLCKTGLKSTMSVQIPNTCVTSIMEYINNEFCGGSTNEGTYIMDYNLTFDGNVFYDGVDYSDINNFVNRHFNTVAFSGFTNAIDNGNIIMTNVPSSIPNSSHNVAVVGYKSSGDIIYMDPEEGKFKEAPSSYFLKNYVITIASCK